MAFLKSGSARWSTLTSLALVLLLLIFGLWFLLSSNSLPFFNLAQLTPRFSPREYYVKMPNKNPDNTYTLTFTLSKIESLEEKQVLFSKYTTLNLRPLYYIDQKYTPGEKTYQVDIPNNLKTSIPYKETYLSPPQLKELIGKPLSLQLIVNKISTDFSAFDVIGWSLLYVE